MRGKIGRRGVHREQADERRESQAGIGRGRVAGAVA